MAPFVRIPKCIEMDHRKPRQGHKGAMTGYTINVCFGERIERRRQDLPRQVVSMKSHRAIGIFYHMDSRYRDSNPCKLRIIPGIRPRFPWRRAPLPIRPHNLLCYPTMWAISCGNSPSDFPYTDAIFRCSRGCG